MTPEQQIDLISEQADASAFPWATSCGKVDVYAPGLTIRDYFAAKAMTQLMGDTTAAAITVRDAYVMADAMMEARKS